MIWFYKDLDIIRYYGIDAETFLISIGWENSIKYLGKECTIGNKQGIIIGIESNKNFLDYYFIIYIPKENICIYELVNNSLFTRTILI